MNLKTAKKRMKKLDFSTINEVNNQTKNIKKSLLHSVLMLQAEFPLTKILQS